MSIYYRTLVLSELGVDVDLLTFGEGQDPDIPNVSIYRVPRFAMFGNVRIGPSMLKLFLDVFVAARAVWLLLRNRYDVVHAHEEAVFISRFLKPIFRFQLIYDMHSSLPQQLTNFDYTDSRLIHYIFRKLEVSSINASDAVITISPGLAEYAKQIIGDPDKIHLIENSIFEPVRLKRDRSRHDSLVSGAETMELPIEGFRFVYVGTFEAYQGIDLLIQSFAQVIERKPEAYLAIVGGTAAQVGHYRQMAKSLGLGDRCLLTGTVSQSLAHSYIQSADALLAPRTNGTNTPLKIYQQLASGRPLIATRIHSITQVLNEDVAFLGDPDPAAFGAAMIEAMSDDDAAKTKAENAIRLYEQKYSREIYVSKLRALLNGLHQCAE